MALVAARKEASVGELSFVVRNVCEDNRDRSVVVVEDVKYLLFLRYG